MATLTKDVLMGLLREAEDGFYHDRQHLLTEVTGDASQRFENALNDPQLPSLGDPHETLPNCVLREKTVRPKDPAHGGAYLVDLRYRPPDPDQTLDVQNDSIIVRWNPYTIEETTHEDINGLQIQTQWDNGVTTLRQNHRWTVQRPVARVSVERTTSIDPATLNDVFGGTVNSTAVRFLGSRSFAAKSVRADYFTCTADRTDSIYRAVGHFSVSAWSWGTWQGRVVQRNGWYFVDDPSEANGGVAFFDIYPSVDHKVSQFVF